MNEAAYHAILRRLGVEPVRPAPDAAMVRQILALPLDRFVDEGCPLEVRVPWLDGSLWFVPGEADAEAMAREGVSRGRIWTAGELMDLLMISGLTPDLVKTIAQAKLELGGEVVEIRSRTAPARRRDGEVP